MNWLEQPEAPPPRERAISFRYFADDTPRFVDDEIAAFWPPPATVEMPHDLPRFANVGERDRDQRAA